MFVGKSDYGKDQQSNYRYGSDLSVVRTPCFSLDYYNKRVIQMIVDRYGYNYMEAARAFLTSEIHAMLEDAELAMWEFSARAIFDMWETEKETGDPRNSVWLRSEA